MPVHNSDIAGIFNRIADFLEIKGENTFRVRAYRNAARTVEGLSGSAAGMVKDGKDLSGLPGIGKDLAGKIEEIVKTGTHPLLKKLQKELPRGLSEIMDISGLGAKRAKKLFDELDIKTVKGLRKAAEKEKIRDLSGFGGKTEEKILESIERMRGSSERIKLIKAEEIIAPFVEYLKKDGSVKDIEIAGSNRRRRETVKDADILVTCRKGSRIMDRFVKYEDVKKVVSKGETRSTVLLRSDFQVDLRVLPGVSYGSAMLYFTGSKAHNIAVRKIAQKKRWKINEYGLFRGKKRLAGRTEEEIYRKVKLRYIEPELREDRGEIEAARKNRLPDLVTPDDIRGDLHTHTKVTDGRYTLEEMAAAARECGYDYIANTEHSKHLTVTGGIDEKGLAKQIKEIDKLNKKLKKFVVLKSIEVDILKDGSLDLPDSILKELDFTVCAVHYKFDLAEKEQTERIIRAMDNKYFNILAHPTGRLIGERPAYEVDMEKIMKAAKERGVALELDARPERLDLNDIHCKAAKDMGIKIAISTDAHSRDDFALMRYGINQARRGWLEKKDVVNTRTVSGLRKALKRK